MESSQFCSGDGNCWCLLKGFSSSTWRLCPDSQVHFLPDVTVQILQSGLSFSSHLPISTQLSWVNTPPIKTEVWVPLVWIFPFPMVTHGETQQFPPAKLVVSFLSYPFSLVNCQSFSFRKSILLQHNKRLKENAENKLYFINSHSSP